jgi:hypothetical protein
MHSFCSQSITLKLAVYFLYFVHEDRMLECSDSQNTAHTRRCGENQFTPHVSHPLAATVTVFCAFVLDRPRNRSLAQDAV